jgi:formate dehydrogenase major subunit
MADELGLAVLRALDKVLADKPNKVGHDFSEATRCVSAWRDALIARWRQSRAPADRRNLERANAALSVVVGGQFPLGEVPWPHLERTRQDLAEMIEGT